MLARTIRFISHVKGVPFINSISHNTALLFRQRTHSHPQRPLLHSYQQNLTLSYSQVYQTARQLAAGLRTLGLRDGDRVGIMSYNRAEWLYVQLASAMANLILVNINPLYLQLELQYCINKVGISALFVDHKYHKHDYLALLDKLIPSVSGSETSLLPSAEMPSLKHIVCLDTSFSGTRNIHSFHSILSQGNSNKELVEIDDLISRVGADTATNIQFTSGTTGKPKGATLTHRNVLNNAFSLGQRTKYNTGDKICVSVPLYHCFGMVIGNLAAITRGLQVIYPCRGFNAERALLACQKYGATSIYGVPTMFIQYIKEARKKDYSLSLRTGIMAGSLCPEKLMLDCYDLLNIKDLTICYGMTQTSPVSFQTSPQDTLVQKTRTVGRILPGMEAKIVDSQGQTVPLGHTGEFWVKGYCVMQKYWGDEEKTRESIEDGWMKSGDLGKMDEEGFLTIEGRIKDLIIRGGENIYPKEIQDFLRTFAQVEDAQVVGVSDQRLGEQVVAILTLKEEATLQKEQVYNRCYRRMAHFKCPRLVKFVKAYPLTVTGKVQKYLMRQELEKEMKEGKGKQYWAKN